MFLGLCDISRVNQVVVWRGIRWVYTPISHVIYATARGRNHTTDTIQWIGSWPVGSVLEDVSLPEFVHDRAQDLLLTPSQPMLTRVEAMDYVPWEIHAIVDPVAYATALYAYALENAATHA